MPLPPDARCAILASLALAGALRRPGYACQPAGSTGTGNPSLNRFCESKSLQPAELNYRPPGCRKPEEP
jgi:hypothetical protein